jgi:hypothetical protein
MRDGSGVFFHSRTPRGGEGISAKTANDRIVATALCRRHVFGHFGVRARRLQSYGHATSTQIVAAGAFHKYNVLSCREIYSLALLPRSAFSLLHWVHLGRTRLDRPSSAMRWSTFGTKLYSIISSTRSRFSCLPFPARPNAAPRGYFVLEFFFSAGVCMRWR